MFGAFVSLGPGEAVTRALRLSSAHKARLEGGYHRSHVHTTYSKFQHAAEAEVGCGGV